MAVEHPADLGHGAGSLDHAQDGDGGDQTTQGQNLVGRHIAVDQLAQCLVDGEEEHRQQEGNHAATVARTVQPFEEGHVRSGRSALGVGIGMTWMLVDGVPPGHVLGLFRRLDIQVHHDGILP